MVDCRLESICEHGSAADLLLLHLEPERRLYGSIRQSPWGFSAPFDWNPYRGCPPCVVTNPRSDDSLIAPVRVYRIEGDESLNIRT